MRVLTLCAAMASSTARVFAVMLRREGRGGGGRGTGIATALYTIWLMVGVGCTRVCPIGGLVCGLPSAFLIPGRRVIWGGGWRARCGGEQWRRTHKIWGVANFVHDYVYKSVYMYVYFLVYNKQFKWNDNLKYFVTNKYNWKQNWEGRIEKHLS